jgi:mannosylglycerate hydrolase
MLSQGPMTTRPLPAGPLTPIEGPQLQRVVTARYAVAVGDVDPYALADDVLVPLVVDQEGGPATPATPTSAASPGEVSGPRSGTPLTVEGAEVAAVVREGVTLRARVFNPRPEPTTVTVEGRRGWLVDLRGRPLSPFDGTLPLAPWSIATLALPE